MTTILILADVHLPYQNEAALSAVEQFMPDLEPDVLVLLGDILDMTPVNHWLHSAGNRQELEGKRLAHDYGLLRDKLTSWWEKCKRPEVWYFLGNHEGWVNRYVRQHPEIENLIEVEIQLDVPFPVKFVRENHVQNFGKLYFMHGIWANKYHANKHILAYHKNLVYGHVHSLQVFTEVTPLEDDPHTAWSIPALCDFNQLSYLNNKPTAGVNGFAVAYIMDDGNYNLYPVVISGGRFAWDGREYGNV